MSKEYNIIHRILRWLLRIRKRQGYGVHSPYAFSFIHDVVYNAEPYYAYAALRRPLPYSLRRLDEYDPASGLSARDLRLLFRLANFQEAHTIAAVGATPTVIAHLTAARPHALIVGAADAPSADLRYTDLVLSPPTASPTGTASLLPLPAGGMHIVRGIHSSKAAETLWDQSRRHPSVTITFDLWRFGILLNRPKIVKQDYIVNYF